MSTLAPVSPDVSWEQDYSERMNPTLLTNLLRSHVPVLEHSGWYIQEVEQGYCESMLPLTAPTTNQHGTHQGALISLSADYTGGVALASLLKGVPMAGVHQCGEGESASLWLASMTVKYKSPSSGHLTGICRVDDSKAESVRKRYFAGQRALVTLEIEFHSNGKLVAIAEMKYFIQPTSTLTPDPDSLSRSVLFDHKLKASARMIAALRARSSSNPRLVERCPYASESAGPHGHLLADRLQAILPQLKDVVLARSQHIDGVLSEGRFRQVVMLGAGLDMRSLKHAARNPHTMFYELDLPEMVAERSRVIDGLPEKYGKQRVMIPADFRNDNPADLLRADHRFDASLPTLFLYEGCSMYFHRDENEKLLRQLDRLMGHADSRIWLDVVSHQVAARQISHPRITDFLEGMDDLGESFLFGVDQASAWLESLGLQPVEAISCGEYLRDSDPVLRNYQFVTAGPSRYKRPIVNSVPVSP